MGKEPEYRPFGHCGLKTKIGMTNVSVGTNITRAPCGDCNKPTASHSVGNGGARLPEMWQTR